MGGIGVVVGGGSHCCPPTPIQAELFRLLPDLSVLPVGTPPQVGAAGGGGDEAHPPSPPHFRQLPPPPYLLSAAR